MFHGNQIVNLLGIDYPIIQGGMAWSSNSTLACAVSDAGGLGIIGCGGRDIDWVSDEIDKSRLISSRNIGLNVALNDLNALEIVKLAISKGIKVFTMGGANTYLPLLKLYGDEVVIIPLVGSVMEAKLAERSGARAIICEGQESGGSIGRLSLFTLLPQVVDAVKIPVIAAGGVGDGRGMRAAFELGAQGVQMGTRFLASKECSVSEEYKNRILKARDTDSIVIYNLINFPARVIKNKYAIDYLSRERNGASIQELQELSKGRLRLAVESDVDSGALMAGEVSGMIREVKSVREIVESVVSEFLSQSIKLASKKELFDLNLRDYLRHEPPFLLIDKILILKPGIESVTSLRLHRDKWFFNYHYPDYPVMPGSLLIEAMSQALTMIITSMDEFKLKWDGILLLSNINSVFFRKEALPGLNLVFTAKVDSFKRGIVKGSISCKSEDDLICSSEMTLVIPSAVKQFSNVMN